MPHLPGRRSPVAARLPLTAHALRFRVVPAAGLALASLLLAGRCEAACTFGSVPIAQLYGDWFENCADDNPVGGFAALISDPSGVNTNGTDGVCESEAPSANGLGQPCIHGGSIRGDHSVVFEYDFGTLSWYGSLGCPIDPYPSQGGNPIIVQVVANDGASSIIRASWDNALAGYNVDFASPYDEATGTFSNLSCHPQSVVFNSGVYGPSGYTLNLTVLLPVLESDCNPGTAGASIAQCPNGAADNPVVTRGHLFTRVADCRGGVSDLRTESWTLSPVQPDASGHAVLTFPLEPFSGCISIGTTYAYDGKEIPAIAGFRKLPKNCIPEDPGCAGDEGSRLRIDVHDASTMWWISESFVDSYNLYRGDLAILKQLGTCTQDPATVPLAARSCDVAGVVANDDVTLAPGQAVFYLITGNLYGEGGLGTNSAGQLRPNTHPCH